MERCGKRIEIASRVRAGALDLFERRVIPRVTEDALGSRLVAGIGRVALARPKSSK